jgi:hypothetical protein
MGDGLIVHHDRQDRISYMDPEAMLIDEDYMGLNLRGG